MKKESVSTKVSETIRLYQWFISTIVSHGHISFSKLNELWVTSRMEEGCPLSRTTFNRYREGIKELYGIEILCETGGNDKTSITSVTKQTFTMIRLCYGQQMLWP